MTTPDLKSPDSRLPDSSLPAPLKLVALDGEDLQIVSAHVQDAVLKVGDLAFRPRERRFALAMNRFDWESAVAGGTLKPAYQRRRTVLHFDRVLSVKTARIDRDVPDAVLELLCVEFEPLDAPAGAVLIHLAGGGTIRLEVECLEAYLTDLGAAWETRTMPEHALDANADGQDRNG